MIVVTVFLLNWKEYDRSDSFPFELKEYDCSDSFPFDYERSGIPFGSFSKGKLSLRSYSFQSERNLEYISMSETKSNIVPNNKNQGLLISVTITK